MEALNNAQQTLKNVTGSPQSGGKKKGCGCSSPVQLGGKKTRRNRKIKGGEGEVSPEPASGNPSSLLGDIGNMLTNATRRISDVAKKTTEAAKEKYNSMRGRDDDDNVAQDAAADDDNVAQNAASVGNFNDAQQTPRTVGGRKRKSKKHRKKSRKHRKRSKKHRKRSKKSRR